MPHPLERLLVEIEQATDAKLYYLALVTSLALPDICGALESPDGQATSSRYRAWYEQWVFNIGGAAARGGAQINADDVYRLRCSFVHQGSTQHQKSSFDRVLFSMPGSHVVAHSNIVSFADGSKWMTLDVSRFCREVLNGVRVWLARKAKDPCIEKNSESLVAYREDGLRPIAKDIPAFW